MIRSGSASAFAGATVVNNGRELTIDVELIEGKSNRARINQSPTRRPREVLGILQSVMFRAGRPCRWFAVILAIVDAISTSC